MTPDERREALDSVAADVRVCTRCRLHQGRTRAVPGEGHPETEVVFVGEGPGFNEDQQGRPFVGAAGGLLTELLASIRWSRDEVFITNVVKCRPPGNRDPEPDEVAACRPYLRRQLEVLDPALVVTLGRHSMNAFLPGARISSAHGTLRPVDPETGAPDALAYAMYHPAVAFRQPALRDTLKEDMAGVPEALLRSRDERAARRARAALVTVQPDAGVPAATGEPDRAAAVMPPPDPWVPTATADPDRAAAVMPPFEAPAVASPADATPSPAPAPVASIPRTPDASAQAYEAAGPSVAPQIQPPAQPDADQLPLF